MLVHITEGDGLKWNFLNVLQTLLKKTMGLLYWIIACFSSQTGGMSC